MESGRLTEIVKKLPSSPGIYIFKDKKHKPLYIGKASNLKNRAKSYLKLIALKLSIESFRAMPRLQEMISESKSLDYIQTDSDIEALILESRYIKKFQPPFNIMLRDDKQYGFVSFTNEKFPKIFITHQPKQDVVSIKYYVLRKEDDFTHNTKYIIHNTDSCIGPFTDIGALKTTLRLLRRIFPYCTCRQLHHNYCLNYHIGKCPGFCCLKQQNPNLKFKNQNVKLYKKNIKAIKDILSGKKSSLIKSLEKEMKMLSGKQEFEKAMELQYKIAKLKKVFQNAQIIQDTRYKILDTEATRDSTNTLKQLAKLADTTRPLHRIEAYDIANIQGKYAVGAMVVFTLRQNSGQTEWQPDKNEYRKFKIYTKNTPDDTAMLKEVLIRRFRHSRTLRTPKPPAKKWPMPDLIIVDGGKQQLRAAEDVVNSKLETLNPKQFKNSKLKIKNKLPIIALTKNEKHTGHKIILENGREISLSKMPINVKNLLLQIDSEAHRFAISYYRKLHRKKALRPY